MPKKKKKMKLAQLVKMRVEFEKDLGSLAKEMSKSNKDAQTLLKKIRKLQSEVQEEVDKAEVKRLKKKVGSKKK